MGIEVGDITTCPNCDLEMVECIKVPKTGDRIDDTFFKPINHRFVKGEKTICPSCNANYMNPFKGMHVKNKGWTW